MSEKLSADQSETIVKMRVTTFQVPPVHDGLVIGRRAAIGAEAFKRALPLLASAHFTCIELKDEIISDLLIRTTLLRRAPAEKFVAFVLRHVKPVMSDEDVLHLDLTCEVSLEGRL